MGKFKFQLDNLVYPLDDEEQLRFNMQLLDVLAPFAGPLAEDIRKALEKEPEAILGMEATIPQDASPTSHGDAVRYLAQRQVLALFQKWENLPSNIDKEGVALERFNRVEQKCADTNDLLRHHNSGGFIPIVSPLLQRVANRIRRVLGPVPAFSDLNIVFGPGATTSVKKKDANPTSKMADGIMCSYDLLMSGRLPEALREIPEWCKAFTRPASKGLMVDECSANSLNPLSLPPSCTSFAYLQEDVVPVQVVLGRLQFVAKTAGTNRTIAVEPVLNGMLQLGVHRWIVRRLAKVGVTVEDQQKNRNAALQGSLDGTLSTIDLSDASDSLSYQLVKACLGETPEWFDLLRSIRTGSISYKGQQYVLEKFSTMGNGFTFALECLIFWAIAREVCESPIVYGDDIIVPRKTADHLLFLLRLLGCSPNEKKTFVEGPFRESCGRDYLAGFPVRPVYVKKNMTILDGFAFHNAAQRLLCPLGDELARAVRLCIPKNLRIYGPDGFGDGHLISPLGRYRRILPDEDQYAGHYFQTYARVGRSLPNKYHGDWVSPLYHVYTSNRDMFGALSEPLKFRKDRWIQTVPGTEDAVELNRIYTFR